MIVFSLDFYIQFNYEERSDNDTQNTDEKTIEKGLHRNISISAASVDKLY